MVTVGLAPATRYGAALRDGGAAVQARQSLLCPLLGPVEGCDLTRDVTADHVLNGVCLRDATALAASEVPAIPAAFQDVSALDAPGRHRHSSVPAGPHRYREKSMLGPGHSCSG